MVPARAGKTLTGKDFPGNLQDKVHPEALRPAGRAMAGASPQDPPVRVPGADKVPTHRQHGKVSPPPVLREPDPEGRPPLDRGQLKHRPGPQKSRPEIVRPENLLLRPGAGPAPGRFGFRDPGLGHQDQSAVVPDPGTGLMGQPDSFQTAVVGVVEPVPPVAGRLGRKGRHPKGQLGQREGVPTGKPPGGRRPLFHADKFHFFHTRLLPFHDPLMTLRTPFLPLKSVPLANSDTAQTPLQRTRPFPQKYQAKELVPWGSRGKYFPVEGRGQKFSGERPGKIFHGKAVDKNFPERLGIEFRGKAGTEIFRQKAKVNFLRGSRIKRKAAAKCPSWPQPRRRPASSMGRSRAKNRPFLFLPGTLRVPFWPLIRGLPAGAD